MTTDLFVQAHSLFTNGLVDSCMILVSRFRSTNILTSTLMQNQQTRTPQVIILYADCLVKNKEYLRSLKFYETAFELLKNNSSKWVEQALNRYFDACIKAKQFDKLKAKFHEVPLQKLSIQSLRQLLIVYDHASNIKSAIECCKQILRLQPLAIEIAIKLLEYGVSMNEVLPYLDKNQFMLDYCSANYNSLQCSFDNAIYGFKSLEQNMKGDCDIMSKLAVTYKNSGDYFAALSVFRKIRMIDPFYVKGMDHYGQIYQEQGRIQDLQRLIDDLISFAMESCETWILLSLLSLIKCDYPQASNHIDKALEINSLHMLSYQIKGEIMLAVGNPNAACLSYRKAYRLSRDIINYEGLVLCYLSLNRNNEALRLSQEALTLFPKSSIAVYLSGLVSSQDYEKAQKLFEKSIQMDLKCIKPLLALSDLHLKNGEPQKAIEIIQSHLAHHPVHTIHLKLGYLFFQQEDWANSRYHYNAALSMFPESEVAQTGLADIEKAINGSGEEDGDLESEDEGDMEANVFDG